MANEDEDTTVYNVVLNDEEQYSIWPADREIPKGWRAAPKQGKKTECLSYIKETWTDMRPLSLRKKMEEWAKNPIEEPPPPGPSRPPEAVDELVERLTRKQAISFRDRGRPESLKASVDRGYVHVTFTETQGETELGVRLETDRCDFSSAQFDARKGQLKLVGTLTLNYEKVRCYAELDLSTLKGQGYLEYLGPVEEWRKKGA